MGQWRDSNSFKHSWARTCERVGVHDLHFHDLCHTFPTWLTQCGVDYAVMQTLKGELLSGSAKYYIHNWNARLRDAVTRLETFTKAVLSGENDVQVPLSATSLPRTISKYAECGAEGQNRTADTSLFRIRRKSTRSNRYDENAVQKVTFHVV